MTRLTSYAVHSCAAPHIEFTKPLHDVEVREKESARFECEVSREDIKVSTFVVDMRVETSSLTSSLLPKVRWFRDGSEIRKGKKYEIIARGRQHILIIHKSVFDDEAEYECDAKTSKSSGMLTVIGKGSSCHRPLFFCDLASPLNLSSQRRRRGSPRTCPTWRQQKQTMSS